MLILKIAIFQKREKCIPSLNFWNPSTTIREVLINIFALFYFISPTSPFNIEMSKEWVSNPNLY